MKFKKSHILLISLISLFLLLGMSAVSAASDDASIAQPMEIDDVGAIDDMGNDDILSGDGDGTDGDDPIPDDPGTGETTDPLPVSTTNVTSENKTYSFGSNITFDVEVKDNQSAPITNIGHDNFLVYYKNSTAENFTEIDFTFNDSKIKLDFDTNKTLPVQNYTIKIVFVNSVIGGVNYTESETTLDLKITKSDTTIDAADVSYKIGDDLIIPITMKVESGKTLNFDEANLQVYWVDNDENKSIAFIKVNNNDIKLLNLTNVDRYTIFIKYIGNANCNPSNDTVTVELNKTNTTIDVSDVDIKKGSDVIIPLDVRMESNKTINLISNDLKVYWVDNDENKAIHFVIVDGGIKLLNLTDIGYYNILIKYLDNANCNASEGSAILRILENNTIAINGDVSADFDTKNVTIPIVIVKDGTAIEFYRENITLVMVYNNGTDYETVEITDFDFSVEEGNYTISFVKDVPFNDAKLNIIYANGTLNETTKEISFIVKNTIISDNTINVNNHTHNVSIPISVNRTTVISYDGKNITNETTLNFTEGDIALVIKYENGEENKTETLDITDFLSGENGNYTINFIIPSEKFNNTVLTVIYKNQPLDETNKTIKLNGIIEANIVPINVTADYQDGQFVFLLNDTVTGPIANTNVTVKWDSHIGNITISNQKTYLSDEDGYIRINNTDLTMINSSWSTVPLAEGTYNLTFAGGNGLVVNDIHEITVNKVYVNILPDPFETLAGDAKNFTVKVVNKNTGIGLKSVKIQLKVKIDGQYNTYTMITDENGTARISVNLGGGNYPLTVSTDDSSIYSASANSSLVINKKQAVLTASDRTILYGSGTTVIVTAKDKKTGKTLPNVYILLQVYTSSKKVSNFLVKTDSKGVARFSTGLTVGKHKVIMTVFDNYYNSSSITRYVTVKKTTGQFSAPKVSTYYKSGKVFKIKLTNTKNKALMYGASVNIKVFISKNRYYNLTGTTNANGLVQFKITFKPGTYKVVVSSADKGYTAKSITSQIKVSKSPIKMAPTSLKVKKGKYFKVKVTSTKSKKVLSGIKVKVKVYTGKKYKTYTIKTNKKGIASLKISQKVGKHKVVLTPAQTKYYTGKTVTKTLKVTK